MRKTFAALVLFLIYRGPVSHASGPDVLGLRISAERAAGPLSEARTWLVPPVGSLKEVFDVFIRVRDDQFLESSSGERHSIAWRYATDGCYARAAVAAQYAEDLGYRRPAKLFLFGDDLEIETPFDADGKAYWYYHVAAAVSYAGVVYVLDPSVEWTRPLTLEEWVNATSRQPWKSRVSVCNTYAYSTYSPCYVSGPGQESSARGEHANYRRLEKKFLERRERE